MSQLAAEHKLHILADFDQKVKRKEPISFPRPMADRELLKA